MSRFNNFDILRLLLAWLVVVAHCSGLSRSPALAWVFTILSPTVAVEGFFVISGCLIVASFERSNGITDYLGRRAERLLPAYYAATLVALLVGVFMTTLPIRSFLHSTDTWKFIGANLVLLSGLHPELPGVFQNNPMMATVNGALWTIKVEVSFYLFVPVFVVLCRKVGKLPMVLICFGASTLYRELLARVGNWGTMHDHALERQLPGELAFFMVGAAVYFYYPWFSRNRRWVWVAAAALYGASRVTGVFAFRATGVSLLVMCLGLFLPVFRGPTRFGDFSYGTYVLHFPIVQACVALGLFARAPYAALFAVVVMVSVLSVISWNLVEKRFLRRQRIKVRQEVAVYAEAQAVQ